MPKSKTGGGQGRRKGKGQGGGRSRQRPMQNSEGRSPGEGPGTGRQERFTGDRRETAGGPSRRNQGLAPDTFQKEKKTETRSAAMRVAVTATAGNLDAQVDPRFGRAAWFVLVDPETMAYEAVANSQSHDLPQGAGIQAGQILMRHRPQVVLTGQCGPKAFRVLQQAGIEVVLGSSGRVRDVVDRYRQGQLAPVASPDVEGHWV